VWGPKPRCNFSHFLRGSPAGLPWHALMVAVIGKACHAAALAVHICSCVVVGLDDQAYVPACECHTSSHTEPKLLSLSVCQGTDTVRLALQIQHCTLPTGCWCTQPERHWATTDSTSVQGTTNHDIRGTITALWVQRLGFSIQRLLGYNPKP
jgi:hypothetical protein